MLNEASASRSKKQLSRASTSKSYRRREAEIKQLERRLRSLEEEAEMLKGAVLQSVEESRKIISDIHLHFNTIQGCMLRREADSHALQIVPLPHHKDRRAGLLQILCQESNPSIINKVLRTKPLLKDCFDL